MNSLLTAALLLLTVRCAAAFSVHQSRFRGFPGHLPDHGDTPRTSRGTRRSGSTRTESSSSSCSATATANSYAGRLDGYASAVSGLVANVCGPQWDGSLQVLRDEMSDVAHAWARATVETSASCETKVTGGGKAKACSYSKSTAFAFEVALATAHAEATSDALNNCNCGNDAAFAFGESSAIKSLIADVYAAAASAVCATGNQVSKAEARVDCAARVFVDVYAKAVAEAAVNADCTKFSDNSIYSNVITEVTTNVDWTEFCDYDDSVVGSANVELYGDTYADAYNV